MLKQLLMDGEIRRNERIGSSDIYLLDIDIFVDTKEFAAGQFVQLQIPNGEVLLRRPLSIADAEGSRIILIYRVVGRGTGYLTEAKPGQKVNVLGPLGKGFGLECKRPLLVGGGLGIAPLLLLAKCLPQKPDILMGCKTAAELDWPQPLFKSAVNNIFITTDDGSMGFKGFTAEYLPQVLTENTYDKIFTCGPEIMMKSVAKIAAEHKIDCEVSLEKRMACGLGACLSCTVETKQGRQKVCKDGPVFDSREVFFDE